MYWSKERLRNDQYASTEKLDARIEIHKRYSTNPRGIWEFAASLYNFKANERILEVGCGTGEFWAAQHGSLPNSCSVLATDFSRGMIEKAKARLSHLPQFQFEVADVEALPYADSSFDCVLAHFMLYHPASQDRALAEIRRVLTPNGRACIITTGQRHMKRLDEIGIEFNVRWRDAIKSMSSSFCEENAEEMIGRHFRNCDKHIHNNNLEVKNAQIAADYMKSYYNSDAVLMAPDFFERIKERVSTEIAEKGFFFIEKRVVLYIAAP